MVIPGRIGAADVHRRPLADGLQPLQHLDVGRAVSRLAHRHYFFYSSGSAKNTGGIHGSFNLSRLTIWCPRPPRPTGSWRKVLNSSLRPFVVSREMAACLLLVQRK